MMKNIILIIVIFLAVLNCKAQSPILSIKNIGLKNQSNAYYKDIDNELNPYEGTWVHTDGNTSLKIKLVKNEKAKEVNYYEDLIIGGYQYIENGVEKINRLSDADNQTFDYDTVIHGNSLLNKCKYLPFENDCIQGQTVMLSLLFDDPISKGHVADLKVMKITVNGQEALRGYMVFDYHGEYVEGEETPAPTLPWQQEYLFIKQ